MFKESEAIAHILPPDYVRGSKVFDPFCGRKYTYFEDVGLWNASGLLIDRLKTNPHFTVDEFWRLSDSLEIYKSMRLEGSIKKAYTLDAFESLYRKEATGGYEELEPEVADRKRHEGQHAKQIRQVFSRWGEMKPDIEYGIYLFTIGFEQRWRPYIKVSNLEAAAAGRRERLIEYFGRVFDDNDQSTGDLAQTRGISYKQALTEIPQLILPSGHKFSDYGLPIEIDTVPHKLMSDFVENFVLLHQAVGGQTSVIGRFDRLLDRRFVKGLSGVGFADEKEVMDECRQFLAVYEPRFDKEDEGILLSFALVDFLSGRLHTFLNSNVQVWGALKKVAKEEAKQVQ